MGWNKKKEETTTRPTRTSAAPERPAPRPTALPERGTGGERRPAPERTSRRREPTSTLGKMLHLEGELTGAEDFTVEGKIDGKVSLTGHDLTVGESAHVTAEVRAKNVLVLGTVVGNIEADDKIEVATSGRVEGDISAPRVVLAEGSQFRGNIETKAEPETTAEPEGEETTASGALGEMFSPQTQPETAETDPLDTLTATPTGDGD